MDLKDLMMKKENIFVEKKSIKKISKQSPIKIFNPNDHLKNLFNQLDNESNKMLHVSWNKLERGLKYDRIINYLQEKDILYNIPDIISKENKEFVINLFYKGELNKLSEVDYNIDNALIENIDAIKFEESTLIYSKVK